PPIPLSPPSLTTLFRSDLPAILFIIIAGKRLRLAITLGLYTPCIDAFSSKEIFNRLRSPARQEHVVVPCTNVVGMPGYFHLDILDRKSTRLNSSHVKTS